MEDQRRSKLHELRNRVITAEYRVDPRAVADAILRQTRVVAVAAKPTAGVLAPIDAPAHHVSGSCEERALTEGLAA